MIVAIHILKHELQLLLRDRQALFLLFLMPASFIFFITLALKDVYLAKVGQNVRLQVVTGPNCQKSDGPCRRLVSGLQDSGFVIQETVQENTQLKSDAVLILPLDVGSLLKGIKTNKKFLESEKVQLLYDPVVDYSIYKLVESRFTLALQNLFIEDFTKEAQNLKKKLVGSGLRAPEMVALSEVKNILNQAAIGGQTLPNPIQQTVPAWALFGMFFIVLPLSSSMIRDRNSGIFKRLLSMPVEKWQLIFGKVGAFFILNNLQFVLMLLMGLYVMPKVAGFELSPSFHFLDLGIITMVCSLTATSYALFLSCLMRTPEQASAVGALSVVILAILGGVMIPHVVMPEFMQKLATISPLYWGLSSYQSVMVSKTPIMEMGRNISVLGGFSLAFLILAWSLFRWSEE